MDALAQLARSVVDRFRLHAVAVPQPCHELLPLEWLNANYYAFKRKIIVLTSFIF
jgi:hypothetical protein